MLLNKLACHKPSAYTRAPPGPSFCLLSLLISSSCPQHLVGPGPNSCKLGSQRDVLLGTVSMQRKTKLSHFEGEEVLCHPVSRDEGLCSIVHLVLAITLSEDLPDPKCQWYPRLEATPAEHSTKGINLNKQMKTVSIHWERGTHLSISPTLLSATIAFKISAFAEEEKELSEQSEPCQKSCP